MNTLESKNQAQQNETRAQDLGSNEPLSREETEDVLFFFSTEQDKVVQKTVRVVFGEFENFSNKIAPREFAETVFDYGRAHRKAGGIQMLEELLEKDPELIKNEAVVEKLLELSRLFKK
ncbi:MAG: hypothetical protein HY506_00060 [Candidatus Yanofskybacteria bacterium]|nr:hypothetical protein [Candidatus Yanofskybacteria bacterium]